MKNYTSEERFDALNRHRESLHIELGTAFTFLTQHFKYENVEDIADTIIHYEKFNELYGEVNFFQQNTSLYKKRHEIFFSENRILTEEETEDCLKKDKEYEIFLEKCHNEAQL